MPRMGPVCFWARSFSRSVGENMAAAMAPADSPATTFFQYGTSFMGMSPAMANLMGSYMPNRTEE